MSYDVIVDGCLKCFVGFGYCCPACSRQEIVAFVDEEERFGGVFLYWLTVDSNLLDAYEPRRYEDRDHAKCSYCGTRMRLKNNNPIEIRRHEAD